MPAAQFRTGRLRGAERTGRGLASTGHGGNCPLTGPVARVEWHVGQEEAAGRRHAQAARRDRNADARAVRRAPQPRRQADDDRAARRGRAALPTCWCRPSPTRSTADILNAAGLPAEADRQFRQRRRQHRRRRPRIARGITVTNTPGVLTEDTADMTMALILAVPRRLVEGAAILHRRQANGPAGRRPGCWATASAASASASSAWAASARRWRGARAPSACRSTITTASRVAPQIERRA